ncbi:conserved oligomeric Golgi complex subunit 5 [Schistocerca nitens]|uniref:conserved oligomeric Golgi complex subunit 5 n=1 Tax=Schistocerca nitens TaxID=7011 RepID=UPI0021190089|nr:conserved oligomeric Golgi complex subunit 5 [Schistocerca nitens]
MPEQDVLKSIEQDEFYKQFINKKKTGDELSAAKQGMVVADQLKKLTEGIALLDKELQQQVLGNLEELLSQANWVEKLEDVLTTMFPHVQGVLSSVERLRTQVQEPYERLERQTRVLARLHATSDTLRHAARTQHLARKLEAQVQAGDISKAAHSLNEIAQLAEDVDLTGLEMLEADQRAIQNHRGQVEQKGQALLAQGLSTNNNGQVCTAIQVFHSLGNLPAVVEDVLTAAQGRVAAAIDRALDVQTLSQSSMADISTPAGRTRAGPGRAAMPSPGNTSAFRTRLWSSLEQLFESVYSECAKMMLLQRVLSRRTRDTLPSPSYLELLPTNKRNLASYFWNNVTETLAKKLNQAAEGSSFLKQALEGEYPKFLRLYLDLCKRLQTNKMSVMDQAEPTMISEVPSKGTKSTVSFPVNRMVVVSFENAYLSRSVSRLLDPVNLMFSGDAVPPPEEVDSLIRTITSELSVSLVDETLSRTVARNIGKAVRLFCLKCEQLTVTDGEATQVIGPCTPGQQTNVKIVNLLSCLSSQVLRVTTNMRASLPSDSAAAVAEAVGHADTLAQSILSPLFESITDAIEAILLTVHNEDFSIETGPPSKKSEANCSLYMKELQGFISRAVSTYLAPFQNQELVAKCALPVAGRSLELFCRHACFVRPLGRGGRRRLAADFVQVETAVAPLCRPLSDVGKPYKLLRALRTLLMLPPEEYAVSPALGQSVPYSMALLALFAHGPPELASPHQTANWSPSYFSQWFDFHTSECERLELMGGALQRYEQMVRQRGQTQFHSIFPIMTSILEAGLKHCTEQA